MILPKIPLLWEETTYRLAYETFPRMEDYSNRFCKGLQRLFHTSIYQDSLPYKQNAWLLYER